jgi:hypothetical protein
VFPGSFWSITDLLAKTQAFIPLVARLVVSRFHKSKANKRQYWQGFLQLSARYGKTGASRKLDTPSIFVALSGKHRHLLKFGNTRLKAKNGAQIAVFRQANG